MPASGKWPVSTRQDSASGTFTWSGASPSPFNLFSKAAASGALWARPTWMRYSVVGSDTPRLSHQMRSFSSGASFISDFPVRSQTWPPPSSETIHSMAWVSRPIFNGGCTALAETADRIRARTGKGFIRWIVPRMARGSPSDGPAEPRRPGGRHPGPCDSGAGRCRTGQRVGRTARGPYSPGGTTRPWRVLDPYPESGRWAGCPPMDPRGHGGRIQAESWTIAVQIGRHQRRPPEGPGPNGFLPHPRPCPRPCGRASGKPPTGPGRRAVGAPWRRSQRDLACRPSRCSHGAGARPGLEGKRPWPGSRPRHRGHPESRWAGSTRAQG